MDPQKPPNPIDIKLSRLGLPKAGENRILHQSINLNKGNLDEYPNGSNNTRSRRDCQLLHARVVEEIARETGFVQRESKLGRIEFLGAMVKGLYVRPDASLRAYPRIWFRYRLRPLNRRFSDRL